MILNPRLGPDRAVGFPPVVLFGADVGTWVLAGATGALAIFTAAMAWFTRKAVEQGRRTADAAEQDIRQGADLVTTGQEQVREAQRQADLASRALEVEREPVIVATTPEEPFNAQVSRDHHSGGFVTSIQEFPVARVWHDEWTSWVIVKVRNVDAARRLLTTATGPQFLTSTATVKCSGSPMRALLPQTTGCSLHLRANRLNPN